VRALTLAWRRLRQQPGFAAAAIGALAAGIAAPTALFAVVNATLLRPLPYSHAEDLYTVRTTMTDGRFTIGLVASAELNALRQTTDLVTQSALTQSMNGTIETQTGTREVSAYAASVGFFDLFGVPMQYGRGFNDDDLKSWFGSRIVLSDHTWRTVFGGDPAIVGRTIKFLTGPGSLVVGIAPPAFAIPRDADLWMALPPSDDVGHTYDAYLRLKPGVRPEQVQQRLGGMWDALATRFPDQDKNRAFVIRPLLSTIVGDLGPIVVIAFVATGLLLLLAMINVANLLLARATTRGREIGVRTALGATRRDVFWLLMGESLLIAAAATLIALPLAYAAVRGILAIGGARLPRVDGLHLDPVVFVFSAVTMVIAGMVVGLAPFAMLAKNDLTALLNEGGRGGLHGRATRRALGAMVIVEVTLAIALVAGAARLSLSMHHLLTLDPGFTAAGRLAIDVDLPVRPYVVEPARIDAWQSAADAALTSLGATRVGVASSVPMRHEWDSTVFVDITGRPTDPASRPNARLRIASPGFFDVMGIKTVGGRTLTGDDKRGAEPVVLVNQAWARKFLPGLDPLHERVNPGRFSQKVDGKFVSQDAAIVGVVRDVPYVNLAIPAEPSVYVADAQTTSVRKTIVITTATGHPETLIPQIRTALTRLDPHVAIDFELLSNAMAASLVWPKLGLLLMATFGGLGVVLAATGVFGVIAFVTAQRSGELAVRLALGGTRGHVFGIIVRQTAKLALAGVVFGVLLAWWSGASMAQYVFQVSPANAIVLGGSAAIVFVVAFAATLPSARRAAAIEPAQVFKV
jgi:predicted permease